MIARNIFCELLAMAKHFEGLHDGDRATPALEPKMCPAGRWTIGYGEVLTDAFGRQLVGEKDRAAAFKRWREIWPGGGDEADAAARLAARYDDLAEKIAALVDQAPAPAKPQAPFGDRQLAALVSFADNVGLSALRQSTLLRLVKAGDFSGAADEFGRWVYATKESGEKIRLSGLVRRRAAEADLFGFGDIRGWRRAAGAGEPSVFPQAAETAAPPPAPALRGQAAFGAVGAVAAAVAGLADQAPALLDQAQATAAQGEKLVGFLGALGLSPAASGWAAAAAAVAALAFVLARRIADAKKIER